MKNFFLVMVVGFKGFLVARGFLWEKAKSKPGFFDWKNFKKGKAS